MIQYILRPAQEKDLSDLLVLARSFPLYNLPSYKKFLKKKLELSEQSFQKKQAPFERNYIFVLEDLKLKKVIGSCQILSFSHKNRSYCYLLENKQSLKLVSVKEKRHQLGGLILNPKHHASKEKFGLQLGTIRFLYMKNNDKDFSKTLEVSLTSPFQKKENPFWMETGAKHLKQNYLQALNLYRNAPDSLLKKLPKDFKVDLKSLSEEARLCLQTVHPQTFSAYKGLLKRGFQYNQRHHLLDGGLYLESKTAPLLKKIENLKLKFEKPKKPDFFLIGKTNSKQTPEAFLGTRVKGEKKGTLLKIEKQAFFKEGERILSLSLK